MSIKRSKEVTRQRPREVAGGFWEKKEPEHVYSWNADVASQPDEAFLRYAPAAKFDKGAAVFHPKFGKGIVTGVNGPKIEILFEDGQKTLAHNPSGGAPAKATILPRQVMTGVRWKLDRTSYGSLDDFVAAVAAHHAEIGVSHENGFEPDAIAIPAPAIDLVYEAVDAGDGNEGSLSATLVADGPRGFRQGELLWKIHQAVSTKDMGDRSVFGGLALSKDAERPVYSLIQGS